MNKQTLTRVGLFVGGFAAGALVGVLATRARYEGILNEEIASVKEAFARQVKPERVETPQEAPKPTKVPDEDISSLIVGLKHNEIHKDEPVNYSNIEEEPATIEDEESTIYTRRDGDPEGPFIISQHDFYNSEYGYDKVTLSYFVNDDTLLDDQEDILPDLDYVIGDESIKHFGYMSGDRNIVYVRNPDVSADFEVLRDERSVASTIYGLDDYDEAKDRKQPRKMKMDEDN